MEKKESFFSQEKIPVQGVESNSIYEIYRLKETGQVICEIKIDAGFNGETVEIAQITDIHFNYCNAADQGDPEVLYTKKCRKWNAGGACAIAAERAMACAACFDQTVVTGDTLDYLSCGAMELMQKYIFDADPQVLCCLGGHELTKQMETGRPDQLPLEERLAILQKFWRHDIHYAAKLIKNKVLAVAIDNSQSHYLDCQIGRLKKDIETAKEKGYIILLFQHEPISTQNPEDQTCRAIWAQYKTEYNFYDGAIVGGDFANAADRKVYQLITENADVVKGIFCGHLHSVFYNEIQASYTDAQGSHKAVIPQYTLTSNAYEDYAGLLMRIIIQ